MAEREVPGGAGHWRDFADAFRTLLSAPSIDCAVGKSPRSRNCGPGGDERSGSGAKAKASAFWASQGLEMPMIQGEHIENAVALGENDDRGVGKANAEV